MPDYVERTWVLPKPGAFGIERSKVEWEKRCRPNAHYLTRAGYYADKLYILVEEEYGYRTFLWIYPGTPKELVGDWCNQRVPWSSGSRWATSNRRRPHFQGEFDAVTFQRPDSRRGHAYRGPLELALIETGEIIEGFGQLDDFDGRAHYHEQDDSYLKVGHYEVNGIRPAEVQFFVLDALAAIR